MNILFYGFRHGHIDGLYRMAESHSDIEKIYCIEDDEAARNSACARLGVEFCSLTLEDALATLPVDAVAIGTKYGERGRAVIKSLESGKHVIADKPICTSLCELSKIRELSEAKKLNVACMLDLRYMPTAITAKRIYGDGKYGELCNISFDGQHCIDYANRPSWYFEEGMHGGTVNDLGIHGVDLVRHIFGLEFSEINFAEVRNKYADKTPDFKDCAMFVCTLENGARVMADVSYSAPANQSALPTYWQFRCWLEKGMMTFSWNDEFVTVFDTDGNTLKIKGETSKSTYLDDFIAEIRSGDRAFTDSVLRSTETCLEIQKKAE